MTLNETTGGWRDALERQADLWGVVEIEAWGGPAGRWPTETYPDDDGHGERVHS
jgi:hypothetical protein